MDAVSVILDLPPVAGPVGTTTESGIESGGTIKSVLERLDRFSMGIIERFVVLTK